MNSLFLFPMTCIYFPTLPLAEITEHNLYTFVPPAMFLIATSLACCLTPIKIKLLPELFLDFSA